MFDCKDSTEVLLKGYDSALLVVTKAIDKIMTGELQVEVCTEDLYRSLFPHVAAALQLSEAGVPLTREDYPIYLHRLV
ncbi:MAG: hypothetical protein WAK17_14555 [Candidatus Nitrosopolaris sp.]